MAQRSRPRSFRRLIPLATALLLAALLAIPASTLVHAQTPPGGLTLVNADRDFIERKGDGQFVARPRFERQIEVLYYAVRDADTGDWITGMYRVIGGEKRHSDGWEYSWEYPALDEQPDLDKDRAYLLVMLVRETPASEPQTFTPSSPNTSRGASGTRSSPPSTRRAGPGPLRAG